MKINSVGLGVLDSTPLKKKSEFSNLLASRNVASNSVTELASLPTVAIASQFPNVNFGAKRNYGSDDMSSYENYYGPQPPAIEIKKYALSKQIAEYIENEDYLSAIKSKVDLASICREQGKDRDAFILEESIRKLYKDLPKYQKPEAKDAIRPYNNDMARYIDKDIERY